MDDGIIKVTINENETLGQLFKRMFNIKLEQNKDVECDYNGNILNTKDCNSVEEMRVKNSDKIFSEYEKDKENLLASPDMAELFDRFRSKENRYADNIKKDIIIDNEPVEKGKKSEELKEELDNLNFSDPLAVSNWLDSIIPYINDINLYLEPIFDKIEYVTMANYIVKKLADKGYTTDKQPINDVDGYCRRLISYQLSDLDKYGFFAYEYADNLRKTKTIQSDIGPINISSEVSENEKIIKTLMKMWKIKEEKNQEVVCIKDDIEYSTAECNSIIELYTKYSESFFNEYENEINKIIASESIQSAISNVNRENVSQNLEKLQQESNNNGQLETECNQIQNMNIDFNNPQEVNNWLYKLSAYINKPYINVVNDIDDNAFYYRSETILSKLKNNGYSTEVPVINNTDDFYRKMIAEKMIELEKYHFFVKDYAEQMQKENIQQPTDKDNQDKKLDSKLNQDAVFATQNTDNKNLVKNNSDKKILAIQLYRQGMIDRMDKNGHATKSFASRKQEIESKINELNNQKENKIDIDEIYRIANEQLEEVIDKMGDEPTIEDAIKEYQDITVYTPTTDKIMIVYEKALKLPKDSQVRNLLIDAIIKLDLSNNKNDYTEDSLNEEKEKLADVFRKNDKYKPTEQEQDIIQKYGDFIQKSDNSLIEQILEGVVLLPKNSPIREPIFKIVQNINKNQIDSNNIIDTKIEELKQQYQAIEQEEKDRKKETEEILSILQGKKEPIKKPDESDIEASNSRAENDEYIKKLQSVGQISVDLERRLDKQDSWMELNTAIALNKVKVDDEVEEKVEEVDTKPHLITKVEKASVELIEKIRSIDFKAGVKKVLEFMKKNAKAVALSVAFLTTVVVGTTISNTNTETVPTPEVSMETETNLENTTLEQTIENAIDNKEDINITAENNAIETANEISLTSEVQEAKENILNGASVYTTASNAMSDTNPLTPSSRQLEKSWENAEPSSYYTMDNGKLQSLSEEEAQNVLSNGGQVVVGMENNGTGIGYVQLDKQETGKTL